jgi:hypothetical protein
MRETYRLTYKLRGAVLSFAIPDFTQFRSGSTAAYRLRLPLAQPRLGHQLLNLRNLDRHKS